MNDLVLHGMAWLQEGARDSQNPTQHKRRTRFFSALLRGKSVHKEICKGSQFLLLRHIDIQLFIFQPVIGVDGNISLLVRINHKRIGGVLVPVGLQNLAAAVPGGVSAAREVGDVMPIIPVSGAAAET